MPLIKSKSPKARQENIRREISAGKDPKQAVAIGYAVQRRAQQGKGKPPAETSSEEAAEKRYRAEDGLRTLARAEQIKGDRDHMRDIAEHAQAMQHLVRGVKSAAISERQAARAKARMGR